MKTAITFKLVSPTRVSVMRDGKEIGEIWSERQCSVGAIGIGPYPHNDSFYSRNSIQVCGFDTMSEVWGCGSFEGAKDCVVHFIPEKDDYYQEKLGQYARYVQNFFEHEVQKMNIGGDELSSVKTTTKKEIEKLKSFQDWLTTGGCL